MSRPTLRVVVEVRAGSSVRLRGSRTWSTYATDGLFTVEIEAPFEAPLPGREQ